MKYSKNVQLEIKEVMFEDPANIANWETDRIYMLRFFVEEADDLCINFSIEKQ